MASKLSLLAVAALALSVSTEAATTTITAMYHKVALRGTQAEITAFTTDLQKPLADGATTGCEWLDLAWNHNQREVKAATDTKAAVLQYNFGGYFDFADETKECTADELKKKMDNLIKTEGASYKDLKYNLFSTTEDKEVQKIEDDTTKAITYASVNAPLADGAVCTENTKCFSEKCEKATTTAESNTCTVNDWKSKLPSSAAGVTASLFLVAGLVAAALM